MTQVLGDLRRLEHLEIPVGHEVEMRLAFVVEGFVEQFEDEFFLEQAVPAGLFHGVHSAFQIPHGAAVEGPDETLFPV